MNINQLRVFVRIAELGNFTKAANEMNYTQTAVSHMILSLEKEFGFTLFHRGRRESRLTQEGAALYKIARDIVVSHRRIEEYVQMVRNLQDGFIRIGLLNSITHGWFGEYVRAFKDAYASVDLQIITVDTEEELISLFEEERLGFAVTTQIDKPYLKHKLMFQDQLELVIPVGHRFCGRQSVGPEELLDEKILLCGEGATGPVGDIFYQIKRETRQHLDCMSNSTTLSLVKAGVGITVVSERVKETVKEGLCFIPFDPPISRDIYFIESTNAKENPSIDQFRKHFLAWTKQVVDPDTLQLPMVVVSEKN